MVFTTYPCYQTHTQVILVKSGLKLILFLKSFSLLRIIVDLYSTIKVGIISQMIAKAIYSHLMILLISMITRLYLAKMDFSLLMICSFSHKRLGSCVHLMYLSKLTHSLRIPAKLLIKIGSILLLIRLIH